MDYKEFNKRIKGLEEKQELSQETFALGIGMNKTYYLRDENRKQRRNTL